jgi:predicted amidohydrolase
VLAAAIQMDCYPGDIDSNTKQATELIAQAAGSGAQLVVLPELADLGYDLSIVASKAPTWEESPFIEAIMHSASEHDLVVVSGSSERSGADVFDSVVVTDGPDSILARYRKVHLFGPTGEAAAFQRGIEQATFESNGIKFGLSVCFDLRFPTMYRSLALQGVEAFIVVSAFPFPRLRHWTTLTSARAIENQAYLIAANRVGMDAKVSFCGSSVILDPFGTVVASLDEVSSGVALGGVVSERVAEVRRAIPVLDSESDFVDVVQPQSRSH